MSWEDEVRNVCLILFGLESHGLRDLVTGTTAPALLRCYALRIFHNLCILIGNGGGVQSCYYNWSIILCLIK